MIPAPEEKADFVRALFGRIAGRYDLLNDLMTVGLHRLWQRQACKMLAPQPTDSVLDACCGSGEVALRLAKKYQTKQIIGADFCQPMLDLAKQKSTERTLRSKNLRFEQADVTALPFADEAFSKVIISFGLRNVDNPNKCLREFWRVLQPGGHLLILEVLQPTNQLERSVASLHRSLIIKPFSKLFSGDQEAYNAYLPSSIDTFFSANDLETALEQAAFKKVQIKRLFLGLACIHRAIKP